MNRPKPALTIALLWILVMTEIALAGQSADAYLSTFEQRVLDELNLARSDPNGYVDHLSEMRPHFNGKYFERPGELVLITQEGIAALEEAIGFLRASQPVPALRPSRGMSLAAQMHARAQQSGAVGHSGNDGSQPSDRLNRFGTWQGGIAENIAYGGKTARGVVIQLIIDDGVPDRGHRINLFNPAYRVVGIGCGGHARFRDVCVINFAAGYREAKHH